MCFQNHQNSTVCNKDHSSNDSIITSNNENNSNNSSTATILCEKLEKEEVDKSRDNDDYQKKYLNEDDGKSFSSLDAEWSAESAAGDATPKRQGYMVNVFQEQRQEYHEQNEGLQQQPHHIENGQQDHKSSTFLSEKGNSLHTSRTNNGSNRIICYGHKSPTAHKEKSRPAVSSSSSSSFLQSVETSLTVAKNGALDKFLQRISKSAGLPNPVNNPTYWSQVMVSSSGATHMTSHNCDGDQEHSLTNNEQNCCNNNNNKQTIAKDEGKYCEDSKYSSQENSSKPTLTGMILLIFLYHATHSSAKKSTLPSSHPSRKNITSVTDEECTSPTSDATSSLRQGHHAHPSLNEDNLQIQQHETEVYDSNQGRNNNDTHQQHFLQINHSHNKNQYFQQESDAIIAGSVSLFNDDDDDDDIEYNCDSLDLLPRTPAKSISEDIRGNPNRETLRSGQPCHPNIPNQEIVNLHKRALLIEKTKYHYNVHAEVLLAPQFITPPL